MQNYKIYFELFGRKQSINIEATSYEEAKNKLLEDLPKRIKFYDNVKQIPEDGYNPFEGDVYNNLKNIMGL